MIRKTVVTREKDTILRLYKTLVRRQLEYVTRIGKNWRKCKEESQK